MGWDEYREETFARQKKLGVIPPNTKLTDRSEGLPAWDSLNADQKRLYARMMEVFAGYAAHCDHEMGRIIDAVKQLPGADNTVFIYIAGDNGSSAEGGLEGSLNENLFFNGFPEKWQDNLKDIDEIGGPKHFNHFPVRWAHAMDTPFQWTKQVASHFGGTRNPMIVSWPARIKDKGGLRNQFLHVIDVVPTLYELIGITPPTRTQRHPAEADRGHQLRVHLRRREGQEQAETQYFEMGCNRGIYHDGWMASARRPSSLGARSRRRSTPTSRSGSSTTSTRTSPRPTTCAKANPEKLRQLQDLWWVEAAKYNVLPLDWRGVERFNAELMGRPSLIAGRDEARVLPRQVGLPDGSLAADAQQIVDDHRRHRTCPTAAATA